MKNRMIGWKKGQKLFEKNKQKFVIGGGYSPLQPKI